MKLNKHLFKILYLFLFISLFNSVSFETGHAQLSSSLSFQADIYGDSGLESIEYPSDFSFHGFGGFGNNAHIFRSRLVSGDEVAFAVSANSPNAFALEVTSQIGSPVTLFVSKDAYSTGSVIQPTESHFRFTVTTQPSESKVIR